MKKTETYPESPKSEPLRILLIEDNPGDARLIQEYLLDQKADSFILKWEKTAATAISLLKGQEVDVIVLDLSLPDSNGLETFFLLQRDFPALPIIILTGYDNDELALNSLKQGAQDYLVKGQVDAASLKRSVHYAVERKRIEEQLRFQKSLLEYESEASNDGILIALSDGSLYSWNRRFKEIWRLSEQSLTQFRTDTLFNSISRDVIRSQDFLSQMIGIITNPHEEIRMEIILNDERIFDLTTAPIKDTQSRFYGRAWYVRDITERKRMESIKDDFIGTVSHELRTPLAIIKGAVGNLKDGILGELSEKQKRVVETTSRNIDRLARLINDLLDLSRLESGKAKAKRRSLDVNSIAAHVIQNFQNKNDKREITFSLSGLPPGSLAYADGDMIEQVLNNLLDNAVRYARSQVSINISLQNNVSLYGAGPHSTPNGIPFMCIQVLDDGPGIEEKHMPLLFNKFEQIHRLAGAGYKGTGLGLAICKEIIDLHHGKIWIESLAGQGASFIFTLPVYDLRLTLKEYLNELSDNENLVAFISMHIENLNEIEANVGSVFSPASLEKEIMESTLRRTDLIIEHDGGFVLLIPDADESAAKALLGRIKILLDDIVIRHGDKDLKPVLQAGFGLYPVDGTDAEQILQVAIRGRKNV